jgi:dihydropteroate synthase
VDLLTPAKGITNIGGRRFVWGERTYVMGVINVTPDSFSNDGVGDDVDGAVRMAVRFQEDGADIIDVGGESTRPPGIYGDSKPISADEELSRVLPMIEAIKRETDLPVSIDTYKASVAQAAIEAGASMINDVWALQRDPDMLRVAAEADVPVVLMHNQVGTEYDDVVPDVIEGLQQRVDAAVKGGVRPENIIVDPGMGFGKTAEQNLEILRRLGEFDTLGLPLLVGMSRKSTIGYVLGLSVEDRVEGTAATVALSIAGGTDIVRVHDVKEIARVARMSDAVVRGWSQDDAG